jgi:hypothetical protein
MTCQNSKLILLSQKICSQSLLACLKSLLAFLIMNAHDLILYVFVVLGLQGLSTGILGWSNQQATARGLKWCMPGGDLIRKHPPLYYYLTK